MAPGLFDFAMASGRIAGKSELNLHLLREFCIHRLERNLILCASKKHVMLRSVC